MAVWRAPAEFAKWGEPLAFSASVGFGDGEAECFEFGGEFTQPTVVVEPRPGSR
jgi:hypothetical protein